MITTPMHPLPAVQAKTLRVVVCGAGAFGRNHIRIYRELAASGASIQLAAIVEPASARIAELRAAGIPVFAVSDPEAGPTLHGASLDPGAAHPASRRGPGQHGTDLQAPSTRDAIPVYESAEALLAAVAAGHLSIDAASIAVPTSAHHPVAMLLLQAGMHVLIEKPIASTLAQADALIALASEQRRVLMVGHLERFNPAVQALAPLLRSPMFFEAHRLSVFSPRSLDTDVVLDLMIHDLDIVLQLAQSAVAEVRAVGLPILSAKTDIANVRVQFASGAVANFTASRVSTERVRKLRFFQPHQYLSVDYARQDLLVIEVTPASEPGAHSAAMLSPEEGGSTREAATGHLSGSSGTTKQMPGREAAERQPAAGSTQQQSLPALGMSKPAVQPGEPLRLEILAFLDAVRTGNAPVVTGQQARDALALALQIQQAIADHARFAGLQAFTAP